MAPPRAQRTWLHKYAVRLYFQHFALLLFILISLFLVAGVALLDRLLWFSAVLSFILLLSSLSYYALYLQKYRKLTDTYTQQNYYLKIFSFWGICSFNILFISCFALIGIVIDRLSPASLFDNIPYREVLLYLFQVAINGAFFGFLDTFNLNLCTLQSGACKIDPGVYASLYAYTVAVTVDITFPTAVKDELCGWRDAVIELIDLVKANQPKEYRLTPEEIKVNQMLLALISGGNLDINRNEIMLVETLKRSKVKEARSVYLDLMQSTTDMVVFQDCLTYFEKNNDSRLKRVLKKIKHPEKKALIREFQLKKRNKR